MISIKSSGFREQVASNKTLKDAGLWEAANSLWGNNKMHRVGDVSQYLEQLKRQNEELEFSSFFGHSDWATVVWESPVYYDVIVPLVRYCYLKRFENGYVPETDILINDMPTGPVKFASAEYGKRTKDDITVLWHLIYETYGSFKYHKGKLRSIVVTKDGVWVLSDHVKSFLPKTIFKIDESSLLDYIGKELVYDWDTELVIENNADYQQLNDLREMFEGMKYEHSHEDIDAKDVLNMFHVAAAASALSNAQYPITYELRVRGARYTVPSLAFFVGLNSLQENDKFSIYYGNTKVFLKSDNGAYSIIDVVPSAHTYDEIQLGKFRKGVGIRQAEMAERTPPLLVKVPEELILRKPKIKDTLDRQRLLKDNVYEGVVEIMQDYIQATNEKKIIKRNVIQDEGGKETVKMVEKKVLVGKVSANDAADKNYVYEVEEIFWQYNAEIQPEELLAYFVSMGENPTYQQLCVKILGVDYMYHYEQLVDALIRNRLLMIEDIDVDVESRSLNRLSYQYLHKYASGNMYEKLQRLEAKKDSIKAYYGDKTGEDIIAAQTELVNEMMPLKCDIISTQKRTVLELDISNSIFWDKSLPDLQIRGVRDKKRIQDLFLDYLKVQAILGGVTNIMIDNGYMRPISRRDFINKYILHRDGKANWKFQGKIVDISSTKRVDVLSAIYPKNLPVTYKVKHIRGKKKKIAVQRKPKETDWTPDEIKEASNQIKAIDAKYYYAISVIKREGTRLFNMFLKNELTGPSQDIISKIWNEKFNNYRAPKESKIPVFIRHARYFGYKDGLFELNETQVSGVHFAAARENNALIAHEVGLGKTTCALALTSHLFETGTIDRMMIVTPTRVYEKFKREAIGDHKIGFRGAVPHINLVDLENAKPNKFEPIRNAKTKEIVSFGLKRYTKEEMEVYDMYKGFLKEIGEVLYRMPNRRFEADSASIDMIKDNLSKYIPKWGTYQFLVDMLQRIELNLNFYLREISSKTRAQIEKYNIEGKQMPQEAKDKIIKHYGKKFSKDTYSDKGSIGDLNGMKNRILDELGEYLPQNMRPNTIVLATHIAFEELRPSDEAIKEVIKDIEDEANYDNIKGSAYLRKELNNQAVSFEKLNIGGIIIDEVHNFNELYSSAKARYVTINRYDEYEYSKLSYGMGDSYNRKIFRFWSRIGYTNERKMTAFAITQQVKSSIMLSATPFTEGPLQMLSVMSLVDRRKMEAMNYGSAYTFFDNFVFEIWKLDAKQDQVGLFASIERYRNAAALSNFMSAFVQFKIGGAEMMDVRPNKYILPDEENRLNHVKSFIPHNPAQLWLKEKISDYLNMKIVGKNPNGSPIIMSKDDICKQEENKIYRIYMKDDDTYNEWEGTEDDIIAYIDENKESIKNYDPDEKWEKNLKKLGLSVREDDENENEDRKQIQQLVKGDNASGGFLKEARVWDAQAMQMKINISPYFIECPLPHGLLPPLEEVRKDKNGNPILINGQPISKRAINFCEKSPKIYYTIECIKSVLDYHERMGQRPSGQIIYMNLGKSFKFDGLTYSDTGKSPLGSAFTLIKNYMAHYRPDIALTEDEIGIIHAGVRAKEVNRIMQEYQDGKIKVIIGSSTIREGIDLQHNSSVMYILQSEFNPTNAVQLEGRIWRQGNRWKNVRIVYVLCYDSNDVFVYSKVKKKIQSIREIMMSGVTDMNDMQIFSFEPAEIQSQLTTDTEKKAELWWQEKEVSIRGEIEALEMEKVLLKLVKNKYKNVESKFEDFLLRINKMSKVLEDVRTRDLVDQVVKFLRETDSARDRSALVIDAKKQIKEGKYQKDYEHIELTKDMAYSLFQKRLKKIKQAFIFAADYRKHRDRDQIRSQLKIELGEKTKQEIYWEAIINAGFDNYTDWMNNAEMYMMGTEYDKVLGAYYSQIIAAEKNLSDIDDMIEDIENKQKVHIKNINNRKKAINDQKEKFDDEKEKAKKEGAFSVDSQIEKYDTTNYLLETRD